MIIIPILQVRKLRAHGQPTICLRFSDGPLQREDLNPELVLFIVLILSSTWMVVGVERGEKQN